jgi:hypothetical protein
LRCTVFINPEVGAALAGGPLAQQRISSADKGRRRNNHNFRVVGSVAVAVCLPTRRDIDEPTFVICRIAEEIVKTGAAADQRSRDEPGRHTENLGTKAGDAIVLYLRHAHCCRGEAGIDLSEELPKKRRRTEVIVSSNWQS